MIRIYTREGFPHGYYDTDSLGLDEAAAHLRAGYVFRVASGSGRSGHSQP